MEPSTSYGACDAPMRGQGRAGRGRGAHASARRQQDQSAGSGGVRAYGQQYGNELMQPEWMTDVPSDLATNWLVMPRPEGMRCLLVTSRGRTVSWLRNGAPLHRFHSPLPGGSRATVGGAGRSAAGEDYCLLDCIFHPPNNTYYVLDLLCWRGYALYDTAAEFRTFWLTSKFQEEGLVPPPAAAAVSKSTAPPPPGNHAQRSGDVGNVDTEMDGDAPTDGAAGRDGSSRRSGRHQREPQQQAPSVSYRQGLRAAYGKVPPPPAAAAAAAGMPTSGLTDPWVSGGCSRFEGAEAREAMEAGEEAEEFEFVRDGLYFLHRQGHYCPGPGTTPLALLWKDLGCSRYLLDTDSSGQPLEHQAVVLSYRADRTVATEDEPPVVLGRLPEAFVAAMGAKLKPGRLLRFSIRQGGIIFHEGRPAGADLHYEGPANQRRGRADSFSKIFFQRLARTAPITASMLAAAVLISGEPQAGPAEPEMLAAAAVVQPAAAGPAPAAVVAARGEWLVPGCAGASLGGGDMAVE
ncbi:hypothetical protein PLESTF_000092700 [Pleodorina starrii]|nr:hypothetical protein PLESTF_000092700 [Pleodorina starrii]